jgi:serine phosphatase RsbU (regulator of sigma subunit)
LVAAIPLVLFAIILYVSGLLFYYQLSYYLVEKQIGIHTAQIQAFNLSLNAELQKSSGALVDPAALKTVLERDAKYLLGMYKSAAIVMQVKNGPSGLPEAYGVGAIQTPLSTYQLPHWAAESGFLGLVREDVQPEFYGSPHAGKAHPPQLYLRSLVASTLRNGMGYSIEISVPLDGEMLERFKNALGQDLLLANGISSDGINVMLQDTKILKERTLYSTFDSTHQQELSARPVWSMPLFPSLWSTGKESQSPTDAMMFVELSSSRLLQDMFHAESAVSRTILGALELVIGFFLIMEILSLIGGILLTKSITSAVYSLDRGTEYIRRGDFSHRIVVRSEDQLGELAKSFNQMTEYVQTLVKERVKKERLERELEIAKEVQEQLFPKSAPKMQNMDITGLCLPARIVSGDYYDFLQLDSRKIGMALGDICGKGISAALLMANLQATLRSNVSLRSHCDEPGDHAIANLVTILNQQIFNFTSANKFASFFYSVYDEEESSLTYCNAGHNPPLYFNSRGVRRLTTGGTVVGIFQEAVFEQETIAIEPGDVFLAYTDGIIECVNEYGEEFGERRLIDLVQAKYDLSAQNLQKAIVDEVLGWAYEEERDDDMTIIVARFH